MAKRIRRRKGAKKSRSVAKRKIIGKKILKKLHKDLVGVHKKLDEVTVKLGKIEKKLG
jgi:hypothetical protein